MNPKHQAALGVLIVALVGGVVWLRSGENTQAIYGDGDPALSRPSKTPRHARPEAIQTRPELSSAEAARRLRDLLTQEPSSSHRFETVERWAGDLDDSAIRELIEELGIEEYRGLTGWVRCALYAEWARRDPRGALARAEALPTAGDHSNYAVQQAMFSVLRGWAESDPEAALVEDKRLVRRFCAPEAVLGNFIYRELARRDPEGTWKKCNSMPWKSFLDGLDGKQSVVHYIERWDLERWSSKYAHRELARYKAAIEAHRAREAQMAKEGRLRITLATGAPIAQMPGDERIAAGAALALAEYDVEDAVTWLASHGPGDDADRRRRITTMLSKWATAHSAEALKLIEQDRLQSHAGTLACGAITGDPGIAAAVMQAMDDHSEQERVNALRHVRGVDSNHVRDFFPAPGLPNRLPNFRERYEGLIEGVEAGNFRDSQKRSLLRFLHGNFRGKVPEAQEAYEAMGEKE